MEGMDEAFRVGKEVMIDTVELRKKIIKALKNTGEISFELLK